MVKFVMFKRIVFSVLCAMFLMCGIRATTVSFAVEAHAATAGFELETAGDDDQERKIFELINKERRRYNLDELDWNSDLAKMARAYSQKMARERFFSHYDRAGNSVADRAQAMKIKRWRKIGENLFTCDGYEKFAQIAVKGWMTSPAHRDNILEVDFNETGIGVARGPNGTIYVTQVFMQD